MSETLELDSVSCNVAPLRSYQLPSIHTIRNPSYDEFFTKYILTNTPCLVKSVTTSWPCQHLWTCDGKPDINFLRNHYGSDNAPITNCREKYFNAHTCKTGNVGEFLDYWKDFMEMGHPQDMPLLYLKDWHFMKSHPCSEMYRVPSIFSSDWLNEYYDAKTDLADDYKFVYLGPKGSWTAFHADVFSSFSWSVNICGKKKWIFYPPGDEENLKSKYGTLIHDLKDLNESEEYPNRAQSKPLDLIQNPGDAVFVPSNWHHQVWNLEDTISLNHNWVNGANIDCMWMALKAHLQLVEKEIEDCRSSSDFSNECQLILETSFGINIKGFLDFLLFIAQRRIAKLKEGCALETFGGWLTGINHMKFDLLRILPILKEIYLIELFSPEEKDRILSVIETVENLK